MPRGRKKTVLEVEIPEDGIEEKPEEKSEEEKLADAAIEESRQSDPKTAYEVVKRVDESTGEEAWMGRWPVNLVNNEFLARKLGPGKYMCYTRKPNGKGGWTLAGSRTLMVGVDLRSPAASAASAMPQTGDFSRDLLITMMKQSQESSQAMVTMMTGLMTAMASAFGSLKPSSNDAVLTALIQAQMQRKDPTEIATALLSVLREHGATPQSPIAQLKELLEVKEMLVSPEGAGDPELALIGKGLDTMGRLFTAVPAGGAPAPIQRQLPANPTGEEGPHSTATPTEGASPMPAPIIKDEWPVWKKLVIAQWASLAGVARFLPPQAAAIAAKDQLETAPDEAWASFVADARTEYQGKFPAEWPDDFGEAFATRSLNDFPPMAPEVKAWAFEVLVAMVELAADEDASAEGRR